MWTEAADDDAVVEPAVDGSLLDGGVVAATRFAAGVGEASGAIKPGGLAIAAISRAPGVGEADASECDASVSRLVPAVGADAG